MACLAFWTSVFSTLDFTRSGWCKDLWKVELRYPSLISPGVGIRAFLMAVPAAAIFPIRCTAGAPDFLEEKINQTCWNITSIIWNTVQLTFPCYWHAQCQPLRHGIHSAEWSPYPPRLGTRFAAYYWTLQWRQHSHSPCPVQQEFWEDPSYRNNNHLSQWMIPGPERHL